MFNNKCLFKLICKLGFVGYVLSIAYRAWSAYPTWSTVSLVYWSKGHSGAGLGLMGWCMKCDQAFLV